jgi:hypothetical protein
MGYARVMQLRMGVALAIVATVLGLDPRELHAGGA